MVRALIHTTLRYSNKSYNNRLRLSASTFGFNFPYLSITPLEFFANSQPLLAYQEGQVNSSHKSHIFSVQRVHHWNTRTPRTGPRSIRHIPVLPFRINVPLPLHSDIYGSRQAQRSLIRLGPVLVHRSTISPHHPPHLTQVGGLIAPTSAAPEKAQKDQHRLEIRPHLLHRIETLTLALSRRQRRVHQPSLSILAPPRYVLPVGLNR